MPTKAQSNLRALHTLNTDFKTQFNDALNSGKKWDSAVDFVTHKDFLGFGSLYPRQRTLLRLMFLETEHMTQFDLDVIDEWARGFTGYKESYGVQPDIWERVKYLKDRGYRRFPHIQAVLGRRASKGLMGGILGAEAVAYMVALDNPQAHYGIVGSKEIELAVIATMLDQAKKFQFADIRAMITSCKYLQRYIATNSENTLSIRTPEDVRRIAEMYSQGLSLNKEIATVQCNPYSSNSAGGRGGAGFALFLDEFAHMLGTDGSRSGEAVYNASKPSLDQFKKDQLLYVASSPFTQVGKFFDLYTQGSVLMDEFIKNNPIYGSTDRDEALAKIVSKADPTKLIVQLASWDLYKDWERSGVDLPGPKFGNAIIEYDEAMKTEERQNPQAFKVERRGQFAEVMDGYLNPDQVDRMFEPYNGKFLAPIDFGLITTKYHCHIDPGRTNANFALSIAHSELSNIKDEFGDFMPHVVIDYMKVWKPEDFPEHTINYMTVQTEMKSLFDKFKSLEIVSMDQWNSAAMIDYFNNVYKGKPIFRIDEATEKLNQQRYDLFKMAVNQHQVHSFKDTFYDGQKSLLELELKFLSEKNGKVVKQEFGPVKTKDLSDTVVIAAYRLLQDYFSTYLRKRMGDTKLSATNLNQNSDLRSRFSNFGTSTRVAPSRLRGRG